MQQSQPDNKGEPNHPRKIKAQEAARMSKTQNPDRQEEKAPPDNRGTNIILAIASTHLMLYETYDAATRATIIDATPTNPAGKCAFSEGPTVVPSLLNHIDLFPGALPHITAVKRPGRGIE